MHVFVGVPTLGFHINTALASWLVGLPRQGETRYSVGIFNEVGGVAAARNFICQTFLTGDADRLWFIDYDCCPSLNALDLLRYDEDIVGGTYPVYRNGKLSRPGRNGNFVMMGATVIQRRVISDRRLALDKFEDRESKRTPAMFRQMFQRNGNLSQSEDADFCSRAKSLGYKIRFVPSVVFDHIKTIPMGRFLAEAG